MQLPKLTKSKPRSVVEIEGAEGISIELIHDKAPEGHLLPMVATLPYLIDFQMHYAEDGWEEQVAGLRKLQEVGVQSLPLYESRAIEAGLKWRVL